MSIRAENISKVFGRQYALNDVSFEIKPGEIVGFLGPNGAGKSTMMKILTGFFRPAAGKAFVENIEINEDLLTIRKKIGYLPEHNPLYLDMYVKEYLQFVAGIYKLGKNKEDRIKEIIQITGIDIEQNKKIGALSKGFRQRVGLAQALIHDPKVLILDEPTSGLDPNQIIEIRNLILSTGKEKTIMLSTHIMQEVEAICDRVIIINKGKIVADGKTSDIQNEIPTQYQTVFIELDKDIKENELKSIPGVVKTAKVNDKTFLVQSDINDDIRPDVFKFAVNKGLTVLSLQKEEKTLEEVFQELTKR